MNKYYLLALIFCLCVQHSMAQRKNKPQKLNTAVLEEEKGYQLNNEASFGLNLNSNGYGINVRRMYRVNGFDKKGYDFDLSVINDPKETSNQSYYQGGDSYVYGKLNVFWTTRAGYGYQKVLYTKEEKSGIEIRYNYFGGISLGFTKPIYLEVVKDPSDKVIDVEKFDPDKHYPENIFGKAPFFQGFNELKLHPGLYGKFSFSFEYGTNTDNVKMLETGLTLDAFPKPIPIMALSKNSQVFLSLFINVMWGKKW